MNLCHRRPGAPALCSAVIATVCLMVLPAGTRAQSAPLPASAPWPQGAAPAPVAAAAGGTFLRFLNAPRAGEPLLVPPRLAVSFGAQPVSAVVDTGSLGVAVSAAAIPGSARLSGQPGRITYTSSGRVMIGEWVRVSMTLAGAGGSTVTTTALPVLAVTRIACLPQARHCTPRERPAGVAMLGIGFARHVPLAPGGQGASGDASGGDLLRPPDRLDRAGSPYTHAAAPMPADAWLNPLLNVALDARGALAAELAAGYVISRQGVTVGLGAPDTLHFTWVRLVPDRHDPPSWQAAPMCLTREGVPTPDCGTLLVDSGTSDMFVSVPGLSDAALLAPGALLRLALVGAPDEAGALGYSLRMGVHASALDPARVIVSHAHAQAFINTGVRFLNGFDLLYDARHGYVAYRVHPLVGGPGSARNGPGLGLVHATRGQHAGHHLGVQVAASAGASTGASIGASPAWT